jgi:hypothetical protein
MTANGSCFNIGNHITTNVEITTNPNENKVCHLNQILRKMKPSNQSYLILRCSIQYADNK